MPGPYVPQNGHMPYKPEPAVSSWAFEGMNGSTTTNPWPSQQQWGLLNGGLPSHLNSTQPQLQMPMGNNGVDTNGDTDDGFGEFAAADHGSITRVEQASKQKADFAADRLVMPFQCMPLSLSIPEYTTGD